MKKKGFTLVELIISIALIAIIGVSTTMVIFNKKNKSTDLSQLRELIINSAATKYLSSSENVEKAKDNYGYLVYKVEDLINDGLVDDEKFNSLKTNVINELKKNNEVNEEYDWDKMVLWYDYMDNGQVNIIYPFEKNKNVFLDRLDDTIFWKQNSSDKFLCNTEVKEVTYFNENYEKQKVDLSNVELKCKEHNSSKITWANSSDKISLNAETKEVDYIIKIKATGKTYLFLETTTRKVNVYELSNITLKATGKTYGDNILKEIKDYNKWYRDVKIQINDKSGPLDLNKFPSGSKIQWTCSNNDLCSVSTFANKNELTTVNNKSQEQLTINANLNIQYASNSIDKNLSIHLNIDNIIPEKNKLEIEKSGNKQTLNYEFTDNNSGLRILKLQNTKNNTEKTLKDNINSKTISGKYDITSLNINDEKIIAIDNAGNSTEFKLNELNIVDTTPPEITVTPVNNSIFDFNISVKHVKNVELDFYNTYIEKNNTNNEYNPLFYTDTLNVKNNQIINQEYSFVELTEKFEDYFWRKTTSKGEVQNIRSVNRAILNNPEIKIVFKVTKLDGSKSSYRVLVTLNANIYSPSGFHYSSYLTSSGIFLGITSNHSIVFSHSMENDNYHTSRIYYKSYDSYDFVELNSHSTDPKSERGTFQNASSPIYIQEFDDAHVSYCYYDSYKYIGDKNIYYDMDYYERYYAPPSWYENNYSCYTCTSPCYNCRTSNAKLCNSLNTKKSQILDTKIQDVSSKSYYDNINEYIQKYTEYDYGTSCTRAPCNTDEYALYTIANKKPILNGDDGYKYVLVSSKCKRNCSYNIIELSMFRFKEKVNVGNVQEIK